MMYCAAVLFTNDWLPWKKPGGVGKLPSRHFVRSWLLERAIVREYAP